MSGHSQFKNIMYRKGAQDKKRAKVFSKLLKEITVAAKEGGVDVNHNPRLRSAIIAARGENMPKDNIDRALKKVEGGDSGPLMEEIRYEGYAPYSVAVIVEVLTDNKNRAASEIRTIFGKNGGNLGETNSVVFMFDKVGCIRYPSEIGSPEDVMEAAIDAGADNMEINDIEYEITCPLNLFKTVRDNLLTKLGEPKFANIIWVPQNEVQIDDVEKAKSLLHFIELLEDNDAVQNVTTNFVLSDKVMDILSKE